MPKGSIANAQYEEVSSDLQKGTTDCQNVLEVTVSFPFTISSFSHLSYVHFDARIARVKRTYPF